MSLPSSRRPASSLHQELEIECTAKPIETRRYSKIYVQLFKHPWRNFRFRACCKMRVLTFRLSAS